MAVLDSIDNAYLLLEDDVIKDFGKMEGLSDSIVSRGAASIDASERYVLPAFCDSHTHIVYAGSREREFVDKIRGMSYEEIAKHGGGILNSSGLLNKTPEEELYEQALQRVQEIISFGTGAVEIKSGYGLNTAAELKMLRVIKKLKETTPVIIKSTFLGAHSLPADYKGRQDEYVDLVINEMIPMVAAEGLADFIDVFCDKGFFSVEHTEQILMAEIGRAHV